MCRGENTIQNLLGVDPQIIKEDDIYYIKIGDQKFPRVIYPIPKDHDTKLEYNWTMSNLPDLCSIRHDDQGLLINFESEATTSVDRVVCDAVQHGKFYVAYTINGSKTIIKSGSITSDRFQPVTSINNVKVLDIAAIGDLIYIVAQNIYDNCIHVYNKKGEEVGTLTNIECDDARITANNEEITVVYRDFNTLYRIYYPDNGEWSASEKITSNCYDNNYSFDVDYREDGEVGVAYKDNTDGTLNYAYYDPGTSSWNNTDTGFETDTDAYISLDHYGNQARIAYHYDNYIDFAWYDGTSFQRHQQIHSGNRYVNLKLHFNYPVGGNLTETAIICYYYYEEQSNSYEIYISYADSSDYNNWTTFEVLTDDDVTSLTLCNNTKDNNNHIMCIAYVHANETLKTCHWDGSNYQIIERDGKMHLTLTPPPITSQYTALSMHGNGIHVKTLSIDQDLSDEMITICEESSPDNIEISGVNGYLRIHYIECFDTQYETLHDFASIYGAIVTNSTNFGKHFIPDPNEFAKYYNCHLASWTCEAGETKKYYTDTLLMMDRPDDIIWSELDYGFLFIRQTMWRHPDNYLLINHYNNKPIVISAPGPDGRPYTYINRGQSM